MASSIRLRGRAPLCVFSLALVTAVVGCGDDGGSGGGSTSGSGSSTTDPTTDASATTSTTEAMTSSSSTDGASSSSTGIADDSTSTTSDEGSSSTGICDPGTQNCVCDAGACEGDLECIEDVCYNPAGCQGKQADAEPNETEATAVSLPGVTCGELAETNGSTEMGDVDYFGVVVDDLGKDCPASDGTIAIITADEELEVCMFFACDQGAVSVNCGADDDATSPEGLAGCCGTGSVEPNFFCSGVTDDSEVWLRVGELDANACVDYALAFRVL